MSQLLLEIERRFTGSVDAHFRYLVTEFGFAECELRSVDMSDIRDARLQRRYVRERCQVEVCLELVLLQPCVYWRQFGYPARCVTDHGALKVIAVEQLAQLRSPGHQPPLPWMKAPTFYEEASRSYRHFSKHMATDLEAAVRYLGSLLHGLMPELLAMPPE